MRKTTLHLLVLFGFIHFADGQGFPPPGNLIVNGSFESGFTGWVGTYGLLNYIINPLPLSGTTVGIVDGGEPAMEQTIPTVIGRTYEIEFGMRLPDLGADGIPIEGDSRGDPALVSILWNNQNIQQILVQNRSTWNIYTIDVVAQATSSDLAFSDPENFFLNGQLEYSASVFIDNVSVVPVPEPSALGILCFGTVLFLQSWIARKHTSIAVRV